MIFDAPINLTSRGLVPSKDTIINIASNAGKNAELKAKRLLQDWTPFALAVGTKAKRAAPLRPEKNKMDRHDQASSYVYTFSPPSVSSLDSFINVSSGV